LTNRDCTHNWTANIWHSRLRPGITTSGSLKTSDRLEPSALDLKLKYSYRDLRCLAVRASHCQHNAKLCPSPRSSQKERGARQTHKRLLYCVNVTSTSLDHLLLGTAADGDQMSHAPSIPRSAKIAKTSFFYQLLPGAVSVLNFLDRSEDWHILIAHHRIRFAPRRKGLRAEETEPRTIQ
jgi:hypothetical protein